MGVAVVSPASPPADVAQAGDLVDIFRAHSVCLVGATGSGKTVLGHHLADGWGRVGVAVLYDTEDEIPGFGVTARDADGVRRAIAAGHRRIRVVAPIGHDAARRLLADVVSVLFRVGDRLRGGAPSVPTWCVLWAPEAQEYASKGDVDGPLHTVLKRGRKRGIRAIVDSQRPAQVAHTVLTQCGVHAIFELSSYETQYFRAHGIPLDEIRPHLGGHRFVLARGEKWAAFGAVSPRGAANH